MSDGKVIPFARHQKDIISELEFLLERAKQGKIYRFAYMAKGRKNDGWARSAEICSEKDGQAGRLIRSVLPPDLDDEVL